MHPIICKIGPLTVYSYGVVMALSIVVCAALLSRDAARLKITPENIFDLVFWVVCVGIVGARVFYVFLNLDYFLGNPFEIIQIQKGGLAWQGGLLTGIITGILYIRKHALPLGKTADLVAPYIALGHSLGRIGCFLNGCCYGKEVSWGIYFPIYHARLHPTQLYESVALFFIFLILKKYQKFRSHPKAKGLSFPNVLVGNPQQVHLGTGPDEAIIGPPTTTNGSPRYEGKTFGGDNFGLSSNQAPGRVFTAYLFLASLERFVVEFFRADHLTTWLGLSIFQWVSLIVMSIAFYAHTILQSRFRK